MNKKTVTALKILTIIFFILMLLSFSSANDEKDDVFVKNYVINLSESDYKKIFE